MLTVADIGLEALSELFKPHGLEVRRVAPGAAIPGTFWGEPEAGLRSATLYLRDDTPVHSALHEGCHFVCMDNARRARLDTDAGGSDEEESAVCYLQVLLADQLPGCSAARLMSDMDAWGYSFRLGSTRAWFDNDANDARAWLHKRGLLPESAPTGC